jgi:hypothetical protein
MKNVLRFGVALAAAISGSAHGAFAQSLIPVPGPTSSPLPTCAVVCYYVNAVSGSDSNDGLSLQTPFATLDKASSLVVPGATVYVMSGTYSTFDSSGATLTVATAGSANAWITFVAYPGQHPVIQLYPHAWQGIHVLGSAAFVVIDGFEVAGLRSSVDPKLARRDHGQDGLYNENCIDLDGATTGTIVNNIIVRNSYVHDCTGAGIGGDQIDYVTVNNNVVAYNAYWSAYGQSGITLYHQTDIDGNTGYKTYVVANLAYGNRQEVPTLNSSPPQITDGNAIIIDSNLRAGSGVSPYGGRTYVANNIVFDNGGRGVHVFSSQHVDAINNTAYEDMRTAVITTGELDAISDNDVNVLNSIGVAAKSKQVDSGYGDTNVLYDYNVYFGTTQIPVRGPHDIVGNPRFVAPRSENFALERRSPALHSGTNTLAPAVDFFGNPRTPGSIDRGAIQS